MLQKKTVNNLSFTKPIVKTERSSDIRRQCVSCSDGYFSMLKGIALF